MSIEQLIEQRISCNYFDATRRLEPGQIERLVQLATRAPSAYNSQNWHFVAVASAEGKVRLLQHAYGQDKVQQAAVTFIVCGQLDWHAELHTTLAPVVSAGLFDAAVRDSMVHWAMQGYAGNAQAQRDEAIRSASLAAMTLMLAAEGMGLASCPMIGFDAAGVQREFALADNLLPVMLLPVGYVAAGNWPQKPRKALDAVLALA